MRKSEAYEIFVEEYKEQFGNSVIAPEIESEEFESWFEVNYQEENMELYNKAKEAYYNGEPIMSDQEFDELEVSLGLENKGYVGTRHNPSYTVKHIVTMGSLSKVQVKEDKNHNIDWESILSNIRKFIGTGKQLIITPKYDGCSFEVIVDKNGQIKSISSRGDGNWGKDLAPQLIEKVKVNTQNLTKYILEPYVSENINDVMYSLRGEVLISKEKFEKYKDKYVNTRSFVAGVLGQDFNVTDVNYLAALKDLDIIIYDFKVYDNTCSDYDWTCLPELIDKPEFFHSQLDIANVIELENIYKKFEEFRKNCKYSLDGFVIKPTFKYRKFNHNDERPKDCVAVKFLPQLQETEVTSITWNLGKTGELIPIINVNPVEMDGKMVSKCSGHNYGYLIENKISKGSKVILSLAGDIIPFLYKVTNTDNFANVEIPENYETYIKGCHLMVCLTDYDKAKNRFINSVTGLNIPNIGPANAKDIFEYMSSNNGETDIFFEETEKKLYDNILMLTPDEVYFGVGGGKIGTNVKKSFKNVLDNITLVDIIKSCNFKLCGTKAAQQIERKLTGQVYDFSHIPSIAFEWCLDENSNEFQYMINILNHLGRTFDDFKTRTIEQVKEDNEKIPVILTGEPNNYSSKGEFLKYNPQYRMTGSWKEVKIVFTNSLESNTGKMKKAREKGIEIRVY